MKTAPGYTKLWPIVWSKADQTHQLPRTAPATTCAGHSNIAERVERLTDQPTAEEALNKLKPLIGEWTLDAIPLGGEPWPGDARARSSP